MFASRFLVVLSAILPLAVTGFGLVTPQTAVRTACMPTLLRSVEQPEDREVFFAFDDEEFMEQEQVVETTPKKPKISAEDVKATLQNISGKVQTFAQDERVKEISGKAADFAKDVMGQLFKPVGEKLKELKKEKEEAK